MPVEIRNPTLFSTVSSNGIVNVKNYGAIGDGSNDDTTAIQNAINSFGVLGGVVFFPAGTYKISSALTWTNPHITLQGASRTDCSIVTNSATANMVSMGGWYSMIVNMTFNSSVTRSAGYAVVMVSGATRHVIDNCEFNNMFGGIQIQSHLSSVRNSEFRTFVAGGSWMEISCAASSAHDLTIFNIIGDNGSNLAGSSGINLQQCSSLLIDNCSFSHAGTNGAIFFNPGAGQVIPSVYASNVFFDQSGYGAQFAGNATGTVQRCKFSQCWFTTSTNDGVRFNSPNSVGIQGVDFVNCDFYQNINGINALAGFQSWSVIQSRFSGNTTTGILTAALSTGEFSVVGNFIGNGSGFGANGLGINIGAGGYASYQVLGNRGLQTNTATGITDAGTVTAVNLKNVDNNLGATLIPGIQVSRSSATAAIGAAETQVIGFTAPANSLRAGTTLRFKAGGLFTNVAASSSIFRIRIGTVTLAGTVPATLTSANGATARANVPISVDALVTIYTAGAGGTTLGFVQIVIANVIQPIITLTTTAAVAVNTTVANIVEFTFNSGLAATTCTFTNATISVEQA